MAESYEVFDRTGFTSILYHLPGNPSRVCKAFNEDSVNTLFPVEREAYERFSAVEHPSSILKYYGVHESIPAGLILELAENRNILNYLRRQRNIGNPGPNAETLYQWAQQAAEALEFAHSLGVYNSDIHCVNFFLDGDLNLKAGDWAGASIDGSRSRSSYRLRHRLFDADGTDIARAIGITATTEIFALGTAFYVMAAGHDLWPDLREPQDREQIKKRIVEKRFPETSNLPALGDIISKCWNVEFASMTEVKLAIAAESKSHLTGSLNKPPSPAQQPQTATAPQD